jgi:hypothetical protein
MLPNFQTYLYQKDDEKALRAIKKIQEVALEKEEPQETFLRLLNQFILIDLKIDREKFVKGSPLMVKEDRTLGFSWKAFTHWIIGQLEKVTGIETSLPSHFRERVNSYNKPWK